MKKMLLRLGLPSILLLALAVVAIADSPHFLYANTSVNSNTGALTVDFKDAGLGTGVTSIQISLHVDTATATYQCWNGGGKHPQAGNKETINTSLDISGTFPVRHGQVTASITVGPPSAGSFSCPSGQSLYLVGQISYTGIFVSDATGNTAEATSDPISVDVGDPSNGGGILLKPAHS
jgi:hypothetical protein